MKYWKENKAPRYALFLKGARRVGKSTLCREFAQKEYASFIEIRFDKVNEEIKDLFVNGLMDLDRFFVSLEFIFKTKLIKRNSLIILDEIQLFPLARQALKTLLEDGRYDYIETGSLAGIVKKSQKEEILIPSEEYVLELFPMDYEEYLQALGDNFSYSVMQDGFSRMKAFGQYEHRALLNSYREYMCIGGYPEVIKKYVLTHDYEEVDFEKKSILNLYLSDIKEQREENKDYVGNILLNIPSELSKHDSVFKVSHMGENARLREYSGPLGWLEDAMIVNTARNSLDPSSALTLSLSGDRFKCYLCDTALLVNLSFMDGPYLDNKAYKAILLDNLHINEGMFIENMTSQALRSNGHRLLFYRERDAWNKSSIEIDFLIRKDDKVIPIEVKSSNSFALYSLKKFKEKFQKRVGESIVLYDGDIKKVGDIIYLPYYLATLL